MIEKLQENPELAEVHGVGLGKVRDGGVGGEKHESIEYVEASTMRHVGGRTDDAIDDRTPDQPCTALVGKDGAARLRALRRLRRAPAVSGE